MLEDPGSGNELSIKQTLRSLVPAPFLPQSCLHIAANVSRSQPFFALSDSEPQSTPCITNKWGPLTPSPEISLAIPLHPDCGLSGVSEAFRVGLLHLPVSPSTFAGARAFPRSGSLSPSLTSPLCLLLSAAFILIFLPSVLRWPTHLFLPSSPIPNHSEFPTQETLQL